jgi:hypothetical protein
MNDLSLTPEEFRHVVRCCRRVLLDLGTSLWDLKTFLVCRLGERHPELALRIAGFDDRRMEHLLREIVAAAQAPAESVLWG